MNESIMYDINELASILNVSAIFIRKLMRAKEIPYLKIGAKLLFEKNEIDMWLDKHRHNSELLNN